MQVRNAAARAKKRAALRPPRSRMARIGGRVVAPLIVRREDVNYWAALSRAMPRRRESTGTELTELGFKGRAGKRRVYYLATGREINPRDCPVEAGLL